MQENLHAPGVTHTVHLLPLLIGVQVSTWLSDGMHVHTSAIYHAYAFDPGAGPQPLQLLPHAGIAKAQLSEVNIRT